MVPLSRRSLPTWKAQASEAPEEGVVTDVEMAAVGIKRIRDKQAKDVPKLLDGHTCIVLSTDENKPEPQDAPIPNSDPEIANSQQDMRAEPAASVGGSRRPNA